MTTFKAPLPHPVVVLRDLVRILAHVSRLKITVSIEGPGTDRETFISDGTTTEAKNAQTKS